MSGEDKSEGNDNRLAKLVEELDAYETKLGLPEKKFRECKHLDLTFDEIQALTPDQSFEIASDLQQFSFLLQREINKQISNVNWATDGIKLIVAKEYSNYNVPYSSPEERRYFVINGNDYAARLERIRSRAQSALDRLSFLPTRIDALANKLARYAEMKYRKGLH